jgi:hypothetical protein
MSAVFVALHWTWLLSVLTKMTVKVRRGYWELKEGALDRTVWRTHFRIVYGLVAKDYGICIYVQGGSNMTGTNCDLFTHK